MHSRSAICTNIAFCVITLLYCNDIYYRCNILHTPSVVLTGTQWYRHCGPYVHGAPATLRYIHLAVAVRDRLELMKMVGLNEI